MRGLKFNNDVKSPILWNGKWKVGVTEWVEEGETVRHYEQEFDTLLQAQEFYEHERMFIKKF